MLLILALCLPFHILGMAGGGDVKVMALAVGWLGPGTGMKAIGIGFILGAVLALVKMVYRRSMAGRFFNLFAYIGRAIRGKRMEVYYDVKRDGRDCVIPLGACICAGILFKGIGL